MSAATVLQVERRPAWSLWLELVDRDVKNRASRAESASLRQPEHLVSWLRALNHLLSEVETHIGDSRLRLDGIKPLPGARPSEEYLTALREHEARHAGRVKYRQGVAGRIRECKFLIDRHRPMRNGTAAEVLDHLFRVENLLGTDDVEAALRVVRNLAARIAAEGTEVPS